MPRISPLLAKRNHAWLRRALQKISDESVFGKVPVGWKHSSDETKIDGGDIYAGSITVGSLNVVGIDSNGQLKLSEIGSGNADNIGDGTTNKMFTGTEQTKLTGIATGADVTASNTAADAAAYTGGSIAVAYTDAKATDANADQTSANTAADTALVSGLAAANVAGWAHGSDATKIDGGDIYTNTITASQIAATTITASEIVAGTITYTELKQTDGSEAVDTNAIRDDATRLSPTEYTAANINLEVQTEVTVQTLTYTSLGGVVNVGGAMTWDYTDAGSGSVAVHLYLYLSSTLIAQWDGTYNYTPTTEVASSLTTTVYLSSGSNTFTLKAEYDTAVSDKIEGKDRSIFVDETKGK